MKTEGCVFVEGKGEIDLLLDEETGRITSIACGEKIYDADAFVLAVGISSLQNIIRKRYFSKPCSFCKIEHYKVYTLLKSENLAKKATLSLV